jgi:hypothetical protein
MSQLPKRNNTFSKVQKADWRLKNKQKSLQMPPPRNLAYSTKEEVSLKF